MGDGEGHTVGAAGARTPRRPRSPRPHGNHVATPRNPPPPAGYRVRRAPLHTPLRAPWALEYGHALREPTEVGSCRPPMPLHFRTPHATAASSAPRHPARRPRHKQPARLIIAARLCARVHGFKAARRRGGGGGLTCLWKITMRPPLSPEAKNSPVSSNSSAERMSAAGKEGNRSGAGRAWGLT